LDDAAAAAANAMLDLSPESLAWPDRLDALMSATLC
jgi:hypothetical protein